MLLRYKIWFSALSIYEIIAVSLLHCQRTCDAMFMPAFCDSWYRYFLFCIAIPLLAVIIGMWLRQIYIARRRHYFANRVKESVKNIAFSIRDQVSDRVSVADIEKMISAALLMGVQRYADRHPNIRAMFDDAFGDIPSAQAYTSKASSTKKSTGTKKKK